MTNPDDVQSIEELIAKKIKPLKAKIKALEKEIETLKRTKAERKIIFGRQNYR